MSVHRRTAQAAVSALRTEHHPSFLQYKLLSLALVRQKTRSQDSRVDTPLPRPETRRRAPPLYPERGGRGRSWKLRNAKSRYKNWIHTPLRAIASRKPISSTPKKDAKLNGSIHSWCGPFKGRLRPQNWLAEPSRHWVCATSSTKFGSNDVERAQEALPSSHIRTELGSPYWVVEGFFRSGRGGAMVPPKTCPLPSPSPSPGCYGWQEPPASGPATSWVGG